MESLRDLYVIGPGPSSSHTIGPNKAAKDFIKDHPDYTRIEVSLFGSLAFTGKGHFTDKTILEALKGYETEVKFVYSFKHLKHPNTMIFKGYKDDKLVKESTYWSVGGGKIVLNEADEGKNEVYPINSFEGIKEFLKEHNSDDLDLFVSTYEDKDIDGFVEKVIGKMYESVEAGLSVDGVLPGTLKLHRIGKKLLKSAQESILEEQRTIYIASYAYAASENNASGGLVVTSPTCGSSGIMASLIYYLRHNLKIPTETLIKGVKVASIFGNLAKKNASISGATSGCQAEIGVGSAMGAALLSYVNHLSAHQVEYAAEVALEHFLGLTCDPVEGYVQIPCIERNAIGALRSYNSYLFAKNIEPLRHNRVSYDLIIKTMKETGEDIKRKYKETAKGGLAKVIKY